MRKVEKNAAEEMEKADEEMKKGLEQMEKLRQRHASGARDGRTPDVQDAKAKPLGEIAAKRLRR
jgi:hypothetical protein